MAEMLKNFLDFLSHLFDLVFSKLGIAPEIVSALILVLIVIVLLGLLIYFSVIIARATRRSGGGQLLEDTNFHDPPEQKTKQELIVENGRLKKRLASAQEKIEEMESHPIFTRTEKTYFAINGITNSVLILGIGILLYYFVRLHYGHASTTISMEIVVGRIMGVIAATILVCGLVVSLSLPDEGRSSERINKSFLISLALAIVAFVVFVTYVLPI